MRKTLLSSLLICATFTVFAQDSEKRLEHQIGLNATNFIQSLFSFNGTTLSNTPYDVQYKGFYRFNQEGEVKHLVGIRAGYGMTKSGNTLERPLSNFYSEQNSSSMDIRFGLEYQFRINERWTAFGGLDYTYHKSGFQIKSTTMSGNQIISTETKEDREGSGFGPVIGFQFNINRYLSLGTELSLYGRTIRSYRTSTSSNNFQPPQWENGSQKSTLILPPNFIYFILRI